MPAQSATAATIPVGGDGWNLTEHVKKLAETLRVLIPAPDQAAMEGLGAAFPGGVLPVPTLAFRLDTAQAMVWDGLAWKPFTTSAGGTPYAVAAGSTSFTMNGNGTTQAVTFPAGRFSAAPVVTLGKAMSGGGKIVFYQVNASTTGFTLGAQTADGSSVTNLGVACQWVAVQMTPTTGVG